MDEEQALLAIGKEGDWEMNLCETGTSFLSLTIEYAPRHNNGEVDSQWYWDILVHSEDSLSRLMKMVNSPVEERPAHAMMSFGVFGGMAVEFVWDDEFTDRVFLKAPSVGNGTFIWTIAGQALADFAACLKNLLEDLNK